MPLFGSFGRENIIDRFAGEGVTNQITEGVFDGIDASVGNVITSPDIKTIPELARDSFKEAFPGEQTVSTDIGSAEGQAKALDYLKNKGPFQTAIKQNVQQGINRVREPALEKTGNAAVRQGVKAFGPQAMRMAKQRLAGIGARTLAGSAASGGLAAPLMTAWAVGDYIDTGIAITTGKNIGQWATDPEKNRGRSGAKRAIEAERAQRSQIEEDSASAFGSPFGDPFADPFRN